MPPKKGSAAAAAGEWEVDKDKMFNALAMIDPHIIEQVEQNHVFFPCKAPVTPDGKTHPTANDLKNNFTQLETIMQILNGKLPPASIFQDRGLIYN